MDIEGGEIAALQGMRRLSEVAPLLRLIIEFSSAHVSSDDAAQRFFSELALNGFTSFYVIGKGLKRLSIPSEVGWLCRRAQFEVVNILCDKGKGDLKWKFSNYTTKNSFLSLSLLSQEEHMPLSLLYQDI